MAEIACRCGAVRGRVEGATPPRLVNRAVCYCDDCQAFAHWLRRADLLDAYGGSDIVQVPPASLSFVRGQEHIAGLRLSPKGLYRWYATCCNTPVGNTVSPAIPFIGIVAQAFSAGGQAPDALYGPPSGAIMAAFAIGEPPGAARRIAPRLLISTLAKVASWRLGGRTWPHPFFDRVTGEPVYAVRVLTRDERDALRPHCGPRPAMR